MSRNTEFLKSRDMADVLNKFMNYPLGSSQRQYACNIIRDLYDPFTEPVNTILKENGKLLPVQLFDAMNGQKGGIVLDTGSAELYAIPRYWNIDDVSHFQAIPSTY